MYVCVCVNVCMFVCEDMNVCVCVCSIHYQDGHLGVKTSAAMMLATKSRSYDRCIVQYTVYIYIVYILY